MRREERCFVQDTFSVGYSADIKYFKWHTKCQCGRLFLTNVYAKFNITHRGRVTHICANRIIIIGSHDAMELVTQTIYSFIDSIFYRSAWCQNCGFGGPVLQCKFHINWSYTDINNYMNMTFLGIQLILAVAISCIGNLRFFCQYIIYLRKKGSWKLLHTIC